MKCAHKFLSASFYAIFMGMRDWLVPLGLGLFLVLFVLLPIPNRSSGQGASGSTRFDTSPGLVVAYRGIWREIRKGTELRRVTLERSDPRQVINLKLLRFDLRWVVPRIVRSSRFNLAGSDVKTIAEKTGAIAAINANYFDEQGRPLGFLKADNGLWNPNISKSSLFTGIFAVKNNLPFIVHRDEFARADADEGLQAGPLLLNNGIALQIDRGATRQSRRSLIGIDKNQKLIVAVTENLLGGLSWAEAQEFFSSDRWHIETTDLLNLDGGGSTQLYVKGNQVEEHVPGSTPVPVVLAFFPKAN